MANLGVAGVVVAIILLVILSLKGFNIFLASMIATVIVAASNMMNPLNALIEGYAPGLASFLGNYFFIFLFGLWMGKVMSITGATESIAQAVVKVAGPRYAILCVPIIIGLLKYGGVDGNVARMVFIPLIYSIFKEANIHRRIMPAVFLFGTDTFFNCSPGVPTTMNIITTRNLGVHLSAAPVIGWIGSAIMLLAGEIFIYIVIKRMQDNGEVFEPFDLYESKEGEVKNKKLPNPVIAILPIIACAFLVNIKNSAGEAMFSAEAGLLIAFVIAVVLNFKWIRWKDLIKEMGDGVPEMIRIISLPAALLGFGMVVQKVPAYEMIQNIAIHAPGSTYIKLILSTNILCAALGSATSATTLVSGTLGNVFVSMGMPAEVCARIMTQTACAFDTVPHNGGVVATLQLCGMDHKQSYKYIFVLSVVTPLVTSLITSLIASIIY